MRHTIICHQLVLGTIAAAALLWPAMNASAAEPLRWKFQVGERLDYDVTQDMTMSMNAGSAGQIVTTMHQAMDMTWDVRQVNDNGEAVIRQTIDHATFRMSGPPPMRFDYDSDAEGPAEGMGARVAPLYDAMMEGEFEFTMTPRGEIRDVKVPEAVLEATKEGPGAATMGDRATAEGLQKMIMQGGLILPEKPPVVGQSWSVTDTMNNPITGKQTIETSYTFEGTKDVDGVTMAIFRPVLNMRVEGSEDKQIKVTEHKSSGEVLFDQDAGRLDSVTLQRTTKMEITVAGQTMPQQSEQRLEITVTPQRANAEDASADPRGATPQ